MYKFIDDAMMLLHMLYYMQNDVLCSVWYMGIVNNSNKIQCADL